MPVLTVGLTTRGERRSTYLALWTFETCETSRARILRAGNRCRPGRGRGGSIVRPMAVTVKVPSQLRHATGGESDVEVGGSTVGEVLDALYSRHGELRTRIAEDGRLRPFVNVYLGEEDWPGHTRL